MPMVTICPNKPSLTSIMAATLEEEPLFEFDELATLVEKEWVKQKFRERVLKNTVRYLSPYYTPGMVYFTSNCTQWPQKEECRLAYAMSAIVEHMQANGLDQINELSYLFMHDDFLYGIAADTQDARLGQNIILQFLSEVATGNVQPTIEELETSLRRWKEFENISLVDVNTTVPADMESLFKTVFLYSHFFNVFEGTYGDLADDARLRNIEEYVANLDLTIEMSKQEVFPYLHCLLNKEAQNAHFILREMIYSLSHFLKMPPNVGSVTSATDVFASTPGQRLFSFIDENEPWMSAPCGNITGSIRDHCQAGTSDMDNTCLAYCSLINLVDSSISNRIVGIWNASTGNHGIQETKQVSMLPVCMNSTGHVWDCWNQVITHKGVCFSLSESEHCTAKVSSSSFLPFNLILLFHFQITKGSFMETNFILLL